MSSVSFLLFMMAATLGEAVVSPYAYVGCWSEPSNARALATVSYPSNVMTLEYCASQCAGVYQYWGVEYGRECYCANTLSPGSLHTPDVECNFPCAASSNEICGGSDRLSLYNATNTLPQTPKPSVVPTLGQYSFSNCQKEGTFLRALTGAASASDNMTNELCASYCGGYSMFGTEYGRECYCGNTLSYGSIPAPLSDCSFPCAGSSKELCGAALRLNLYTAHSTKSSLTSTSTLRSSSSAAHPSSSTSSIHHSSSTSSSIRHSTSATFSNHHSSSTSCYIHHSTSSTSSSHHSSPTSASVHYPSTSSVHHSSSASSSQPVSRSTSTRTSTTTFVTKTSTTSLPVRTPSWNYVGCFSDCTDGRTPDKALSLLFKSEHMSPELCISSAAARKTAKPATTYHYVALEHGRDCYGATVAPTPIPTSLVGASACTNTCLGNIAGGLVEFCGGWGQYDLYASVTGKAFSGAVPTSTLR